MYHDTVFQNGNFDSQYFIPKKDHRLSDDFSPCPRPWWERGAIYSFERMVVDESGNEESRSTV